MTETIALTRRELEAKISERAATDPAFREAFLADPTAAVVRHGGVPAAQLPNIMVHEETSDSWHIVLPAAPSEAGELSEEDLEKISGGSPAPLASAALGGLAASAVLIAAKEISW